MISCKTNLSFNGQSPVECLPITENNAVSLCQTGVTSRDSAIVSLQLDEHNELVVVRLAETPVTLERAGRRITLRNKPIRICEKDTLWIDNTSIEIVKSTFVYSKPVAKSPLIQTARKIIAASAAIFSMTAFAACDEEGCDNGQQKCKKDGIYICANGSWNLLEKCGDEEMCVEHDNSSASCELNHTLGVAGPLEECAPDEMKCKDNNVYKCDDGYWVLKKECYDGCYQESNTSAFCNLEPEPGVAPPDEMLCNDDEMKCDNNKIYKCIDGFWELEKACTADEFCTEKSNTSAVCIVDTIEGGDPEPEDPVDPIEEPDPGDQANIPTPEPVQPPDEDA